MAGTVLTNISETVFSKTFMYGTRPGGTQDAVEFGALQNVRLSNSLAKALLRGPEALPPLAMGITEENYTGSFQFGVVLPDQFIMLNGGSQTYDAGTGRTTYTKLVNQEPGPFNLKCKSDSSATPDLEINLFRCVMDSWEMSMENRNFVLPSGNFTVYGEASGGRLYTISKPGDLTNAS